ncbi:phosphoacetylglucosamine mutase [Coprinellus micaceus]|uniref:Phosphoacetylglucosamine mutase n=1 Tax=Coprinellus micaceus TaxID=71717 RepID=A0A4Y7TMN5_COPMI|nr:phosphoacetylglucosamine mutase [Coprinellus micaceus]
MSSAGVLEVRGPFPSEEIQAYSDLHPKPRNVVYSYGTAGFRTLGSVLDSVLFRVGILAALRSKKLDGKTIGVMITASHNPEEDNGVKLVDPRGEMLEAAWEHHATLLANSPNEEFVSTLYDFIRDTRIDMSKPSRVVYARDTRPSGESLVKAFEDGLKSLGAEGRDAAINTKGTKEEYGEDSEDGYYQKMSEAFRKLVSGRPRIPPLVIDCANGVGAHAAQKLAQYLGETLPFVLHNTDTVTPGGLNHECGADYVKTSQRPPPSLIGVLQKGQRACSLDGDADRLMYYFIDERNYFLMLDGDKIATLVASFIVDLVRLAGLSDSVRVGVVQTAYANGASTKYLSDRLPVKCTPTGVKHLHHAAEQFNIGVYFEANGHGTPSTPAQSTALKHLRNLTELVNQTVGDALSDMLLVEVVLAHKAYSAAEWNSLYTDLPNRLVKVHVPNRHAFKTEDAERRLVTPQGLQAKIEELVNRYESGRSFVRPSGTEDVVRVYAEAGLRSQADELAYRVGGLVFDEAGGDPSRRPKEFY